MENRESINQQRDVDEEKEFFNNKIQVLRVTKEEFLSKMKNRYPKMDDAEILQAKGYNFNQDNKTIILMRTDIFPQEYMPYLETHEKWEAYIARKEGYNLFGKSVREYKEDNQIDDFDDQTRDNFHKDLSIYNYEFRHEYAIYKEYEQAMTDGKLDEYHKWIMDLREKEKKTGDAKTLALIKNDTQIRESIYKKLREGTKHYFLRK
jgi:hypothetical protein